MKKEKHVSDDIQYSYRVKRSLNPPGIDADWHKEIWEETASLSLDNFMGDRPEHFPPTRAKLRYDDENIYVIFTVSDRYVKAVEKKINGKVWQDSCVEFFFSPGPDTERGYFNFELNCKGVFLFHYHTDSGRTEGPVAEKDYEQIKVAYSLKRDAEEEIKEPVEWTVEYSISFDILDKYMKVEKPAPGVQWRANFYKCADKTSHPHWLTWAPVDHPTPKFHLPEFFGLLEFE